MRRNYGKVEYESLLGGRDLLGGSFILIPDKAKPSVRRGRKAAGLIYKRKMAELPKD